MNNCAKYQDLISAYIDGQVTPAERDELMAHVQTCESCAELLAVLTEISDLASEEAEPPAELLTGVMSQVRKMSAPKKKSKMIYLRYAAVAACAALAIFAGTKFAPQANNDAAMYNTGNAPSTADQNTGGNMAKTRDDNMGYDVASTDAEDGAEDTMDTAVPNAITEADGAMDDGYAADVPETPEMSDNRIAPGDSAPEPVEELSPLGFAQSENCFAIVYISGLDSEAQMAMVKEFSFDFNCFGLSDGSLGTLIGKDSFNRLCLRDDITIEFCEGDGDLAALVMKP